MLALGRKVLSHEVPSWVDPDADEYFVTICCQSRGTNQLCLPQVGSALLNSVRFYIEQGKWHPSVFLLMPDHLHMLVRFGRGHTLPKVVAAWKRYGAKNHQIIWQQGFFEHRLRREESTEEKGNYILQNPVRAGLVDDAGKWLYVLRSN